MLGELGDGLVAAPLARILMLQKRLRFWLTTLS